MKDFKEWMRSNVTYDPHWEGKYMTLYKRNIDASELYQLYLTEQGSINSNVVRPASEGAWGRTVNQRSAGESPCALDYYEELNKRKTKARDGVTPNKI